MDSKVYLARGFHNSSLYTIDLPLELLSEIVGEFWAWGAASLHCLAGMLLTLIAKEAEGTADVNPAKAIH
jgi:hypothetical protein